MYEFKMPALGAEMTEGTLLEWKVREGDQVKAHDIIAVIDTDKAAIEAEVFHGGVVEKLVVQPGQKVPVGTVLAHIRDGEGAGRAHISPRARKLAEEQHIDLSQVQGTGPDGSIVEADLKQGADRSASMQKAIAAAMAKSKREIPHYYLSDEINFQNVLNWLDDYNRSRSVDERILYAAVLIKAVALALKKHPEFNGFYVGGEFQPREEIHVGVAISIRGGGLVAPAIFNADQLSLAETMKQLSDLVARTRGGKLLAREMSEPTITLTNLGELGVDSLFGVIYPPQVALVGFGKVSSNKTIMATLSADHRVTNGLSGSRFLNTTDQLLQQPGDLS